VLDRAAAQAVALGIVRERGFVGAGIFLRLAQREMQMEAILGR
jgi:hypothetical protein